MERSVWGVYLNMLRRCGILLWLSPKQSGWRLFNAGLSVSFLDCYFGSGWHSVPPSKTLGSFQVFLQKNLSTHQLSAPSPSTTSRPSRDISSPKVHPISKANSSYQKILLHNQLCSFKFPIVLCELCFVLHFHSFIVLLAVLFVDHCTLYFVVCIAIV